MGKSEHSEIKSEVAIQPYIRFVTAASLFDGHDAAINIMRRKIFMNWYILTFQEEGKNFKPGARLVSYKHFHRWNVCVCMCLCTPPRP